MIFPRPSATSPQKNPAISIFYPGEAAAHIGFEVDYWDERFDDFEGLKNKAKQAKIFGVSSLSGFMLGRTIDILKWCKKEYPDKPTILGGVHATFLPENSLQEPFVDYVVLGEGEERLPKLLEAIFTKKEFKEIDGIGYKENGELIINERKKVFDLANSYVSPLSHRTERYFKIAAKRNEVILPSSRGCPWSRKACTFCCVDGQYLGKYRALPFKYWQKDVEKIYNLHPFTLLELEDENSAYFLKYIYQYGGFLKSKGIKYHLHLRADQLLNEEKVNRMAETGCMRVHIGVESGNERIRNEIFQKKESNEDIITAVKLLAKHGIEGVYTYMIGAPTETQKEISDTLQFSDTISQIHPKRKSRSTIYVLMALPGTIIFETAKKWNWKFPQTMEEWSLVSAASNPELPNEINNIYLIGGLHHNRYHKTAQNFPGLWRLLIAPLEILAEIRWQFRFFKFFTFEKLIIEKLISFRSKKN